MPRSKSYRGGFEEFIICISASNLDGSPLSLVARTGHKNELFRLDIQGVNLHFRFIYHCSYQRSCHRSRVIFPRKIYPSNPTNISANNGNASFRSASEGSNTTSATVPLAFDATASPDDIRAAFFRSFSIKLPVELFKAEVVERY